MESAYTDIKKKVQLKIMLITIEENNVNLKKKIIRLSFNKSYYNCSLLVSNFWCKIYYCKKAQRSSVQKLSSFEGK